MRLLLVLLFAATMANAQADKGHVAKLAPVIAELQGDWSKERVFIDAIAAQNRLKLPVKRITEIDDKWLRLNDRSLSDGILQRPCSEKLRTLLKAKPFLSEAFIMDNQGAVVCMTSRTSDYYQGDEDKWKKSFNGGKGGIFYDERKFDASANAVLLQVSFSIEDKGKVIGAATVGINVDAIPDKK